MDSHDNIPASQHTLFMRGFDGDTDMSKIRDFFTRNGGKCSFDFFKNSQDNQKLFVALRFESRDIARDVLAQYNNTDILGSEIKISWFKDIRRYAAYTGQSVPAVRGGRIQSAPRSRYGPPFRGGSSSSGRGAAVVSPHYRGRFPRGGSGYSRGGGYAPRSFPSRFNSDPVHKLRLRARAPSVVNSRYVIRRKNERREESKVSHSRSRSRTASTCISSSRYKVPIQTADHTSRRSNSIQSRRSRSTSSVKMRSRSGSVHSNGQDMQELKLPSEDRSNSFANKENLKVTVATTPVPDIPTTDDESLLSKRPHAEPSGQKEMFDLCHEKRLMVNVRHTSDQSTTSEDTTRRPFAPKDPADRFTESNLSINYTYNAGVTSEKNAVGYPGSQTSTAPTSSGKCYLLKNEISSVVNKVQSVMTPLKQKKLISNQKLTNKQIQAESSMRLSQMTRELTGENDRQRKISNLPPEKLELLQVKRKELEQHYKTDCETFATVVKMLISKDPSLEERILSSLRESLKDIGQKFMQELNQFVDQLIEDL